jgi:hypothetical protein
LKEWQEEFNAPMVRATASHLFKQVALPWVICEWRVLIWRNPQVD